MGILFRELLQLSNIITIFCVTTLIIGIIFYIKTDSFKGTPTEIKLYGMLSSMRNIDAIILAFSMIQITVICYAAIAKEIDLKTYGIIIAITSAILILYNIKSLLIELLSLGAQIVAIYFNQMLFKYRIQVTDDIAVRIIQAVLIIFIILYAIYSFLLHIESITKKNINVRRNQTNEKE